MSVDLKALLARLLENEVNFILVGGLAAVAQGAPVTTFDADIVHERSDANVDRLLAVLTSINARVRDPAGRDLRPSPEALAGTGHSLLQTDLGPLDCLGAIEGGHDYAALRADTVELELEGFRMRVLTLAKLLEFKQRWDDDESKLRAQLIRRTLEAADDVGGGSGVQA